jgi:hypothetical protein
MSTKLVFGGNQAAKCVEDLTYSLNGGKITYMVAIESGFAYSVFKGMIAHVC